MYDQELPADRHGTVKAMLASEPELEELARAVVRLEACHHVLLVKKLVTRFVSQQDPSTFNHSAEDLFAYGYIGLSNALKGYDPATNSTISTFSAFRITGAVRDGIRSESPVPKRLTTFVRKVRSVEEALTISLSRVPTQEEVRSELGDDARYFHLYPRLYHQASLDEISQARPLDEDGFFASPDDTTSMVESHLAGEDIREALQDLTDLERTAVRLLHVDGMTLHAAAQETGIPRRELKANADSAIEKLRAQPRVQQWRHLATA